MLTNYAKLIFNCNELPKDVEHSNAYFRRFLIVPFDITIPEQQQDKDLATKIINAELSGVFNWVLAGLKRLLEQKRFTHSEAVNKALEKYKVNSNTVSLFLKDKNYVKSAIAHTPLKELYIEYRIFCCEGGNQPVNKTNFVSRLETDGILMGRDNTGNIVYIETGLV